MKDSETNDFTRYVRRTVGDSVEQLIGAPRYLGKNGLILDGKTKEKIDISRCKKVLYID